MAGRCPGGSAMSGGVGQLVMNGPLILAVPVAAAAGAITFISPCCLPLIPGYLSYVTGMSGAGAGDPAAGSPPSSGGDPAGGPRQGTAQTATIPRDTTGPRTATAARATAAGATAGAPAAPARGRALAGIAPVLGALLAL